MTADQKTVQTIHNPTWCPGCGNFGIWSTLKQVFQASSTPLKDFVVVYDVGCSSNMNDFIHLNNFHALHGRAIPVAEGIKLANHGLKVVVVIGDGGCYGEGVQHLIASARGNHDITVIVHNNELYALTTGQASPTTEHHHPTKTTPDGVIEIAFNPIAQMISSGASFVARGYAGALPQLNNLMTKAIALKGFAIIDVIQPCTTFNSYHDFAYFQDKVYDIATDKKFDPKSLDLAMQKAYQHKDKIPTGLIYLNPRESYHQSIKYLKKPLTKLPAKNNLSSIYQLYA